MTEGLQQILQHLFGAESLNDVSIDQLRELVDEYPAFNAGHYLLSRKLQVEKNESYQQENQRTALYFNNPFWLQWLLLHSNGEEQPNETAGMIFASEQNKEPEEIPAETFLYKEEMRSAAPDQINGLFAEAHPEAIEIDRTTIETNSHIVEEERVEQPPPSEIYESDQTSEIKEIYSPNFEEKEYSQVQPSEFEPETLHESGQPEILQTEEQADEFHTGHDVKNELYDMQDSHMAGRYSPQPEEAKLKNDIEQEMHEDINTEQAPVENLTAESISITGHEEIDRVETNQTTRKIEAEEEANQSTSQLINVSANEATSSSESLVVSDQYQTQHTTYEHAGPEENSQQSESGRFQTAEEISAGQARAEAIASPVEQGEEKSEVNDKTEITARPDESVVLSQENSSVIPPEEPPSDQLVFEPYHTIDYFASQGIKLVAEENPTDRFGKQLKSFTDWLKVMKKLPQMPTPEEPDDQADAQIQRIAARSIEEKDTITETMAEVLAKQEKYDKAIEVYLQLSLLNPTKIAYFAAKIEQLKKEKQ